MILWMRNITSANIRMTILDELQSIQCGAAMVTTLTRFDLHIPGKILFTTIIQSSQEIKYWCLSTKIIIVQIRALPGTMPMAILKVFHRGSMEGWYMAIGSIVSSSVMWFMNALTNTKWMTTANYLVLASWAGFMTIAKQLRHSERLIQKKEVGGIFGTLFYWHKFPGKFIISQWLSFFRSRHLSNPIPFFVFWRRKLYLGKRAFFIIEAYPVIII